MSECCFSLSRYVEELGVTAKVVTKNSERDMNSSGIYKISFTGSDKFYIGSTRKSFRHRLKVHFASFCRLRHYNKEMSLSFSNANGELIFEILEELPAKTDLDCKKILFLEQFYIDSCSFSQELYNGKSVVTGGGYNKKFNDSDVVEIFKMRSKGVSCLDISRSMNCTSATISKIISRKTYFNVCVPEEYITLVKDLPRNGKSGLKHSERFKAVKLRSRGFDFSEIAKAVGFPKKTVAQAIRQFKPKNENECKVHKIAMSVNNHSIKNEDREEIFRLRSLGLTYSAISKVCGVSYNVVCWTLNPQTKSKMEKARIKNIDKKREYDKKRRQRLKVEKNKLTA